MRKTLLIRSDSSLSGDNYSMLNHFIPDHSSNLSSALSLDYSVLNTLDVFYGRQNGSTVNFYLGKPMRSMEKPMRLNGVPTVTHEPQ